MRAALSLAMVALVLALPAVVPGARAETGARAAQAVKVFSGTGPGRLGTLRVRRGATLRWRATRELQLYDRRGFMVLNSGRRGGRLQLRRGVYRDLAVVSAGRWRIKVRFR